MLPFDCVSLEVWRVAMRCTHSSSVEGIICLITKIATIWHTHAPTNTHTHIGTWFSRGLCRLLSVCLLVTSKATRQRIANCDSSYVCSSNSISSSISSSVSDADCDWRFAFCTHCAGLPCVVRVCECVCLSNNLFICAHNSQLLLLLLLQ